MNEGKIFPNIPFEISSSFLAEKSYEEMLDFCVKMKLQHGQTCGIEIWRLLLENKIFLSIEKNSLMGIEKNITEIANDIMSKACEKGRFIFVVLLAREYGVKNYIFLWEAIAYGHYNISKFLIEDEKYELSISQMDSFEAKTDKEYHNHEFVMYLIDFLSNNEFDYYSPSGIIFTLAEKGDSEAIIKIYNILFGKDEYYQVRFENFRSIISNNMMFIIDYLLTIKNFREYSLSNLVEALIETGYYEKIKEIVQYPEFYLTCEIIEKSISFGGETLRIFKDIVGDLGCSNFLSNAIENNLSEDLMTILIENFNIDIDEIDIINSIEMNNVPSLTALLKSGRVNDFDNIENSLKKAFYLNKNDILRAFITYAPPEVIDQYRFLSIIDLNKMEGQSEIEGNISDVEDKF